MASRTSCGLGFGWRCRKACAVVSMPGSRWPSTTQIATSRWPRNERSPLVGLKTTSYAENAVCLAEAKATATIDVVVPLATLLGAGAQGGTIAGEFVTADATRPRLEQ